MIKFNLSRCFPLLLLFSAIASPSQGGEANLSLPSILQREYGKLLITKGWGAKKVQFHRGSRNNGVTRIVAPKSASDSDIAELLLNTFWDSRFRNAKIPEFAPINRDVFLRHGIAKLTGQDSSEPPIIHDWWNVRMGEPLPVSKTHQLVVINIYKNDGGFEAGHFCLGVRKIGGDADGDFVIDLRAPWYVDRAANMQEALNHDNKLINLLIPNNMYDWFYTQGEFRGCQKDLWFCDISDAQVRLLEIIVDRENRIKAGPFRPMKGNCASLGELVLDRILPFDMPVRDSYTIANVPRPMAMRSIKRFGGSHVYTILPPHQREGVPITAASKIHPAEPSRGESVEFLALKKINEIN